MKKLLGFLFIVLLIIFIIVFSNRYYSKKDVNGNYINSGTNKTDIVKHKKVDLDDISINKNKKKENVEEVKDEDVDNTNTSDTTTTNTNTDTSTNKDTYVPNTATDDNSDYVKIDYYKINVGSRNLNVGETTDIIVKVYPENASEKEVSFESLSNNICSVTSMGKVRTYSKGDCRILIKVKNTNSYNLLINVN